jgi:hypothetical protein
VIHRSWSAADKNARGLANCGEASQGRNEEGFLKPKR